MKITSYEQAVQYLESFIGKIKFEITPESLKHHDPLERMRVLLSLLGNPQDKFQSVLVGGTAGKGSTAYLISHILTTSGYKTGITISPHLQKANERLQINGKSISDQEFTRMVSLMVQIIELMKKTEVGAPSYFEILIAMAFLYFVQNKVDIAVVEVGMGGEFDATNTLYPLVSVLTNVSLDHTNILGKTVQKIARTKAGIIKGSPRPLNDPSKPSGNTQSVNKNSSISTASGLLNHDYKETVKSSFRGEARPSSLIVVTGVKQPSVIRIVEDRRKEVGAEVFRLHKDFNFKIKKESLEGSVFDLIIFSDRRKRLNDLGLSLLGRYQIENASLAVKTALELEKFGFKVSNQQIRTALKTAFFPGRFEIVCFKGSPRPLNDSSNPNLKQSANLARGSTSEHGLEDALFKSSFRGEARPSISVAPRNYILVIDGAHNPAKMKAFLTTLKKLYPKEKKIFLIAIKNDKDIKTMLSQIVKVADEIIVTEFSGKTDTSVRASAPVESIKYEASSMKHKSVSVEKDSKKALKMGLKTIQQSNNLAILVVTGSLYLVGEIRNMLYYVNYYGFVRQGYKKSIKKRKYQN